jgi:D-beta-D-heptose 7-phosphate kinase/D-beta-D-heptose 1-phosphate adenosyltransferase
VLTFTPATTTPRKALVVGDIMLDRLLEGGVTRLAPSAPVPVLRCRQDTLAPAGAGNVAVNLAALGVACDLVGPTGVNPSGAGDAGCVEVWGCLRQLRRTHPWTSHPGHHLVTFYHLPIADYVTPVRARLTDGGRALFRVDWEGDRPLHGRPGMLALHRSWLNGRDLTGYAALALVDYGQGGLPEEVKDLYLQAAEKVKLPSVVEGRALAPSWKLATVVKMNEAELDALVITHGVGGDTREQRSRRLAEKSGLNRLVVTLGREGLYYYDALRGLAATHGPVRVDEVDAAGAGDVVTALLTAGLAAGMDPAHLVHPANTAAALAVARPGTCVVSPFELNRARGRAAGEFKCLTSLEEAEGWAWYAHQAGKDVVLVDGCFDLFHAGHLELLQAAARYGDALVVCLAEDDLVTAQKGPGRPVTPFMERYNLVAALPCVDAVACHNSEKVLLDTVKAIRPKALIKGPSWREKHVVGADLVAKHGGRVEFLTYYNKDTCSAAAVIERCRRC